MSIDVEGGGLAKGFLYWRMPQSSRPSSKYIGQEFGQIRLGHQGEQSLRVEVAVGPLSASEQCERIAGIAAQIPGPTKPDDLKKQQGQHQHPARGAREAGQTRGPLKRTRSQSSFQGGKQVGFLGCGYEEESPCPFQKSRFL